MSILDKIPEMDDAALTNLRANALRLEERGSKSQQKAAQEILPALTEELEIRHKAAQAASLAKRRANRAAPKAAAAAAAAAA